MGAAAKHVIDASGCHIPRDQLTGLRCLASDHDLRYEDKWMYRTLVHDTYEHSNPYSLEHDMSSRDITRPSHAEGYVFYSDWM